MNIYEFSKKYVEDYWFVGFGSETSDFIEQLVFKFEINLFDVDFEINLDFDKITDRLAQVLHQNRDDELSDAIYNATDENFDEVAYMLTAEKWQEDWFYHYYPALIVENEDWKTLLKMAEPKQPTVFEVEIVRTSTAMVRVVATDRAEAVSKSHDMATNDDVDWTDTAYNATWMS